MLLVRVAMGLWKGGGIGRRECVENVVFVIVESWSSGGWWTVYGFVVAGLYIRGLLFLAMKCDDNVYHECLLID